MTETEEAEHVDPANLDPQFEAWLKEAWERDGKIVIELTRLLRAHRQTCTGRGPWCVSPDFEHLLMHFEHAPVSELMSLLHHAIAELASVEDTLARVAMDGDSGE